jgi:hypothetical protein
MNVIDTTTFARLIAAVEKPGRYTGGELNAVRKPDAFLRVGLSYPDLYEVGMSNNGVRILYDAVNRIEEFACERVFAVPADFEERLRALALPLFTLESRIPLSHLDMLGFNLSHELLYTNVLQILDLGGIPLLARERAPGDPIVVAGGEAASNPAPMLGFFDAFFVGDGEEGIVDIARVLPKENGEGLPAKRYSIRSGKFPACSYHPAIRSNTGMARLRLSRGLRWPGASTAPPRRRYRKSRSCPRSGSRRSVRWWTSPGAAVTCVNSATPGIMNCRTAATDWTR